MSAIYRVLLKTKLFNIFPFPAIDRGYLQRPKLFHTAKNAVGFYKQEACQANCSWQESRSYILSLSTSWGSGQPWSPLDLHTQLWQTLAVLSGLGPPCPRHLGSSLSLPSLWFRKLSFFPSSDDLMLSFSNYLLLFFGNLNIWEALKDQICRGHSLRSNFYVRETHGK